MRKLQSCINEYAMMKLICAPKNHVTFVTNWMGEKKIKKKANKVKTTLADVRDIFETGNSTTLVFCLGFTSGKNIQQERCDEKITNNDNNK